MTESPSTYAAPEGMPRKTPEPHPSVDTWIDYHAGKVSDAQAEELRRHLAGCRRCVDLVLDVEAFAAPSPPPAGAADFEKAAVWRTVQHAVEPRPRTVRRWPAVAAIAASLSIAALGLSAWSLQQGELNQLREQAASLSSLQSNAVILNLRPGSRERSSGSSITTVDLGDEPRMLVFILNLIEEVDYPDYEVRVVDSSAAEVARISELEISDLGNFQLALLPGTLGAGSYELRLFGLEGESDQQLETFPIRLR